MIKNSNNAFPQVLKEEWGNTLEISTGLTKRELFAAMALQGILANPHFYKIVEQSGQMEVADKMYALVAIEHADALINELQKEK